jgi:MFS family permease
MYQNFNWKWNNLVFVGRLLTSSLFFMYVGSLPFLLESWNLTASAAGLIQTAIVAGFALSLFVSSYLCDYYNPNKILIFSAIGNIVAGVIFYLIAKDFITGFICNLLLGLFQGGIYGPSMILVSEQYEKKHRGFAMGSMLAGQSFGYALSLSSSFILSNLYSPSVAFLFCLSCASLGIIPFFLALKKDLFKKYTFDHSLGFFQSKQSSQNKLLVSGYTAHCVELFGMWSWLPVFLSFILIKDIMISPWVLGVIIGLILHLSGMFAGLTGGMMADQFGRKNILVIFALVSSILSFLIGWTTNLHWIAICIISIIYSFFTIGDSGVLTAALSESTERNFLGRALAYRSIIGMGLGSFTPGIFGFILDWTNNHEAISQDTNWIYAFSFLGVAGLIATMFAYKTDKKIIG